MMETPDDGLKRPPGPRWLSKEAFARSLEQDMDAVTSALTHRWSNGRIEGFINKLKLLKRQMCGRAGIEPLRRRFLALGG